MSGKEMEWEAPLPEDLSRLLEVLKGDVEAGS